MPPPPERAASAPAAAAPMEEEEPPELAGERKLAQAAAPRAKDTFVPAAPASKSAASKPRGGREGGRAALGALDANRAESGTAPVAKPKRRCARPRPSSLPLAP